MNEIQQVYVSQVGSRYLGYSPYLSLPVLISLPACMIPTWVVSRTLSYRGYLRFSLSRGRCECNLGSDKGLYQVKSCSRCSKMVKLRHNYHRPCF